MIQREFLKRFNITRAAYKKTRVLWDDLTAIRTDYEPRGPELLQAAENVMKVLSRCDSVHSARARVKDPWHTLAKVIRKRLENPKRVITAKNYLTDLTDLMGVRGLHLFKADWQAIDEFVRLKWKLFEDPPTAYVREGDDCRLNQLYEKRGCAVKVHPCGYRSVHYIVEIPLDTKTVLPCEIQIRTIFEEGWSEIDHRLRYPYEVKDKTLAQYLLLLNRTAGGADDMGTFIQQLVGVLRQERDEKRELRSELAKLRQEVKALKNAPAKKKTALASQLTHLDELVGRTTEPEASWVTLDNSGVLSDSTINYLTYFQPQKCVSCGRELPLGSTATDGKCSLCRFSVFAAQKCRVCGQELPLFSYSSDGRCTICAALGRQ
jgi:ppGpp synthetase/RelA/SpoT-type nucleotidyltranferase/predicted RNA-binding Zn-ribbon protein involved in translation (DUF1610 family)